MVVATATPISSLQRQTPFFADSSLTPGSAVEMPQQPDWTSRSAQLTDPVIPAAIRLRWTFHGGSEVVSSDATIPPQTHQLFFCFQLPQICVNSADSQTSTKVSGCPNAVIADKIKHKHFQKESKLPFLPPISVLPLCSQSAQPFQPLSTRADAWQAISVCQRG